MERRAVVLAAKKTDMAITRGVKSQGSRAIAGRHGETERSLFADDHLLGGASGKRTGPPQTKRYRSRAYDDPRGAG